MILTHQNVLLLLSSSKNSWNFCQRSVIFIHQTDLSNIDPLLTPIEMVHMELRIRHTRRRIKKIYGSHESIFPRLIFQVMWQLRDDATFHFIIDLVQLAPLKSQILLKQLRNGSIVDTFQSNRHTFYTWLQSTLTDAIIIASHSGLRSKENCNLGKP